jgi:hypothetical protein
MTSINDAPIRENSARIGQYEPFSAAKPQLSGIRGLERIP